MDNFGRLPNDVLNQIKYDNDHIEVGFRLHCDNECPINDKVDDPEKSAYRCHRKYSCKLSRRDICYWLMIIVIGGVLAIKIANYWILINPLTTVPYPINTSASPTLTNTPTFSSAPTLERIY